MGPLVWLGVAGLAAAGAYLVGWPAWRSYREREALNTNAERYLAWRGRAPRGSASSREGWTPTERRRLVVAAALAVIAALALVAFFAAS